jgi:hypothetical protein
VKNEMVKIKSLDIRIEQMEKYLENLKQIRITEPNGIDEIICKMYVECGNMQDIWAYLGDNGYRRASGGKYDKPHISNIIDEAEPETNIFAEEAQNMLNNTMVRKKAWGR